MLTEPYGLEKKLRVALFGAGKMGLYHAQAIQLQKCAELVAVADPLIDEEKLYNIVPKDVNVFTSPEKLLQTLKPDVVHISTPPHTHAALSVMALNHGSHIYVEKPFTQKIADAKDIFTLAEKEGLSVCAGHQLLYEKPCLEAEKLIERIGRIVHIESYFSFKPTRRYSVSSGYLSPIDQILDILPHPICLLLHFLHIGSRQKQNSPVETLALGVQSNVNVYGTYRLDDIIGTLIVTLEGRPVDSFVRIIGTNGSIHVDLVRSTITDFIGAGTSTISKILYPYSQASQITIRSTRALAKRFFSKQKSYPGLVELIEAFYKSLLLSAPPPFAPEAIMKTVGICEAIETRLREGEVKFYSQEGEITSMQLHNMHPVDYKKSQVLITGGTGLLGRAVTLELRKNGWPVRVVARHIPSLPERIPGIQYEKIDLSMEIPGSILDNINTVIHCAAETTGGKEEHQRNSINATRNLLRVMSQHNIKRFIHISSIAVLKSGRETGGQIDENTPVDFGNYARGPYVWGKAEAERIVCELCKDLRIDFRIIRPGPLVDFEAFEPPGRLGRTIGNVFVAVGNQKRRLSLCDVTTAAKVIQYYLDNFNSVPTVLNMVEPDSPTRAELVANLSKQNPSLKIIHIPLIMLRILSPPLKLLQKLIYPKAKPIDIYTAFVEEHYNTDLAAKITGQAINGESV